MVVDGTAAAVTAAVGAVLMTSELRQWTAKHRPYALWWAVAFGLALIAAGLEAVAIFARVWNPEVFRGYAVAAGAVPAVMGQGSMVLLFPRWARYYGGIQAIFLIALLAGLGHPIAPALLAHPTGAATQVTKLLPSPLTTLGFAGLGGLGGLALILGALWSYWRRRLRFQLGLALGGLLFSVAGTSAQLGTPAAFFVIQAVAMLVLEGSLVDAARGRPEGRPRPA